MTYNPCGHGVDFGRRSYTVTVRPFRDSNITTTLLWYPADRKKGPLPFPSRISSLDWATEPHRHEGVGEVYGADRKFVNNRGLGPIAGDHICGTEDDFRNGAKLSDGRPVLTYLPSGLPTCCDPGRREAVLLLGVDPVSRMIRGKVYRSTVPMRVTVSSRTVRSDPYRSDISVSLRTTTRTVRSDPYHSTAAVRVDPVTHTVRSDPYHSTAVVRLVPVTTTVRANHCPALTDECVDAPPGVTGEPCSYGLHGIARLPGFHTTGWRRWAVLPGHDYRITMFFDTGPGTSGELFLYRGTTCGDKEFVDSVLAVELEATMDVTATGDALWLWLDNVTTDLADQINLRCDPL